MIISAPLRVMSGPLSGEVDLTKVWSFTFYVQRCPVTVLIVPYISHARLIVYGNLRIGGQLESFRQL